METIILIGNVGRNPEMRYTPAGQPVTNFSLAVNEQYNDANGQKVKKTKWFRVSAWGKLGEVVNQYVTKGRQVCVTGKLVATPEGNPRMYQGQDGTTHTSFELNARAVEFLGNGGAHDEAEEPAEEPAPAPSTEEIPF